LSKQIVSTLQADTRYVETGALGSPSTPRSVVIKGVVTRGPFVNGVRQPTASITPVSEDDAAFLAAHPHFVEHQQRGFVRIEDAA
jgi:hypothetical protein